tara:strand:+ start:252 stop:509 length:258 start_codon:yes stop_codon:yes gene_type:complete
MAITHDLIAKGETYTNKDGEEKVKWIRCGVAMDTKNGGVALKIESLPVNFDGWLQMREPLPKDSYKPNQAKSGQSINDHESDIPF